LAVADEIGAEVVVPVCASALPSGPVDHEAYETFCHLITGAVAQGGFDAIWLDLHGAMVAEKFDDGEGELLSRIRAIDPHTPLWGRSHGRSWSAPVSACAPRTTGS
jgi:microcystin degradation protein MlrC